MTRRWQRIRWAPCGLLLPDLMRQSSILSKCCKNTTSDWTERGGRWKKQREAERERDEILIELLSFSPSSCSPLPPLTLTSEEGGAPWDLPASPGRGEQRKVHLCNSRVWETIPPRTENPQQLARLSLFPSVALIPALICLFKLYPWLKEGGTHIVGWLALWPMASTLGTAAFYRWLVAQL